MVFLKDNWVCPYNIQGTVRVEKKGCKIKGSCAKIILQFESILHDSIYIADLLAFEHTDMSILASYTHSSTTSLNCS